MLMIPICEDVLKLLQKTIFLIWIAQIITRLKRFTKPRKLNIEIALFTTQSIEKFIRDFIGGIVTYQSFNTDFPMRFSQLPFFT